MSALETRIDPATADEWIGEFFSARASDVDAGRASVRDGLALLGQLGLADAGVARSAELIGRVARFDLASAFSAWAHRMTLEYLVLAPATSPLRELRAELSSGRVIGATALAAGAARVLTGSPLPLTYREVGDEIRLDGRVPWASNLLPPFAAVTAAGHADDERRAIVVVLSDTTPGVTIAPYPELLALGATGSSSLVLADARVPAANVVSDELGPFVERILPPFLVLQSSFCVGLAAAALDAAQLAAQGPGAEVLGPEIRRLADELAATEGRIRELGQRADRDGAGAVPRVDLLRLRLRAAHLATDAVAVELAASGGRAYLRTSSTARRVREAAFLPIQSPTEVQLRWILSRSA